MKAIILILLGSLLNMAVDCKVKPNSLFSDGAVLQQGVTVPVWGTAEDGEAITVDFNGQHLITVVTDGKWMVKLKPMKAGGPFVMTIKGQDVLRISDILIGEVWLCSGQSNMEFMLGRVIPQPGFLSVSDVLKDAQKYPSIRQYFVPVHKYTEIPVPVNDAYGKWSVCDSVKAKKFSAVAYFFARELYRDLKVPIGLINSTYGGTPAENWTSLRTLDSIPELKDLLTDYYAAMKTYPQRLDDYNRSKINILKQYVIDSATAVKMNTHTPRKPSPPLVPSERGGPGGLYNTMILPLIPYAVKGVIWYQGEANAERGVQYRTLFPALIADWRRSWHASKMPFLFVQIPGWRNHMPELREAQLLTWKKVPNTSMTVITDCDDTVDVHPPNKQPVGERLSLAAKAVVYHEPIEYSGPLYQSMKVTGKSIFLTFTHTGKGLMARNGDLKDFMIAGSDKVFLPAKAIIKGNQVIVYNEAIANPVAVRLGWRLCPQVNLYNKEGLVATSFRTDCD